MPAVKYPILESFKNSLFTRQLTLDEHSENVVDRYSENLVQTRISKLALERIKIPFRENVSTSPGNVHLHDLPLNRTIHSEWCRFLPAEFEVKAVAPRSTL